MVNRRNKSTGDRSRSREGKTPTNQERPEPDNPSPKKPFSRLSGILRANLPVVRFVTITAVSLVAMYALLHTRWFEQRLVDPYTHFVAACSRACLKLVGIDAWGAGETIASSEFSVTIKNVCNGLEVVVIFLAATLGFPATWKNRLIGVTIGYPVIFLINIIRIMVLFVLGFKIPSVFEAVHFYYAQAFVIIATVGVWLLWVTTFSAYGSKTRNRVSG